MIAALLGASDAPAAEDCTLFVRAGFVAVGTADGKTPATAFPTLGAGARAIHNPGDVLCVGPGDYAEGNIEIPADGAPGEPESGNASPVVVRADPTGASTGDPPGPVIISPPSGAGASVVTTGFLIRGRQYVIIDGFKIRDFSDAGIQVRASVDGTNSANVTLRNNTITNCRTGIDVLAQGMIVIEGNSTIDNRGPGISVIRCLVTTPNGRCRIGQFKPVIPVISNNRSGGNDAHGIFIQAADNAVLQNNVIYSNGIDMVTGAGITLRECNDTLIANNLVYANREQGIVVGKQDLASPGTIVLNNTIYANGDWGLDMGSAGAGSPRGTVLNNIVWRNHEGAEDGTRGIGIINENSGTMPVRPASTCGYTAGFNFALDLYGPDTPFNVYDRHDDPLLVNPAGRHDGILGGTRVGGRFVDRSDDDDFHLQQLTGQALSPAVDRGSAPTTQIQLGGSTATDGRPDTGTIDVGFHYGASAEQVLAVPAAYMPIYVRRTGNSRDSNDGLTPNSAKLTIRAAAQEARAGITVVVGPGRYQECDIAVAGNKGKAAFLADVTGERTGENPRPVFVDANQCIFNQTTSLFDPGDTGFDISSVCDVSIDGFHVTGAKEDGIRIDSNSDRAVVRNNVVFSVGDPTKRTGRGIRFVDSNDVRIFNNLIFGNMAGISIGGKQGSESPGSRRATIEFNTVYNNVFNGIQVGDIGLSTDAAVRYNITAANGKNGIDVGNDQTRVDNLAGFRNAYNLVADGYASGVERDATDLVDLDEPIFLDPTVDPNDINANVDWLVDQHFRLIQSGARWSRAVNYADVTAGKAGVGDLSTSGDGSADVGPADLGYHYPRRAQVPGDCNGDRRVIVSELIMSVNIALDRTPMSMCTAVDLNGDGHATVNELIAAVGSALE